MGRVERSEGSSHAEIPDTQLPTPERRTVGAERRRMWITVVDVEAWTLALQVVDRAAVSIRVATVPALEIIGRCALATVLMWAWARLAMRSCWSGGIT